MSLSKFFYATLGGGRRIYVSSLNGNDSNDGFTSSTALATLSTASTLLQDNTTVLLERGSHWNGSESDFKIENVNITVKPYGTGDKPIITGAELCDTITKTGGYTNIYESTHDFGHGSDLQNGRPMIYENGFVLKPVSTLAGVDAEAGTYYYPESDNTPTGTITIYFHATESENPTSNGKVYFVNAWETIRTKLNGLANNLTVEDIVVGYNWAITTLALEDDNVTCKRTISLFGGKHNYHYGNNNDSDDNIAYEAQDNTNIPVGSSMYVTYTNNLSTKNAGGTYTNDVAIVPVGKQVGGWITHTEVLNERIPVEYIDCKSFGLQAPRNKITRGYYTSIPSVLAEKVDITDAYLKFLDTVSGTYASSVVNATVLRSLLFSDAGTAMRLPAQCLDINITDSVIWCYGVQFLPNDTVARTIRINNSVMRSQARNMTTGDNVDYIGDYNVWLKNQADAEATFYHNSGSLDFEDWIRTTGQDQNSVTLLDKTQTVWINGLNDNEIVINPNLVVWGIDPIDDTFKSFTGTFSDGTPLGDKIQPKTYTIYDFTAKIAEMNSLVQTITNNISIL